MAVGVQRKQARRQPPYTPGPPRLAAALLTPLVGKCKKPAQEAHDKTSHLLGGAV